MPKYITNREETVLEMFQYIPNSHKIDILVGFCYFSGIQKILENPQTRNNFLNTTVQILVGLDIDQKLRSEIEEYLPSTPNKTIRHTQQNIIEFLNSKDFTDKETLDVFFQKIQDQTLQIRKTKNPVHAKIYLFQRDSNPDTLGSTTMITGSSNLTSAGLETQVEFNVIENNQDDCKKGQDLFDELWEDSYSILDHQSIITMKPKIGLLREVTPYEVYLKVLDEYFTYTNTSNLKFSPKKAGFHDYQYQIDAINLALQKINTHQGVLIADVVGLGKSIIASCIAKNLLTSGLIQKIFVVVPPPLMDSWKFYKKKFGLFSADIESLGQLESLRDTISELSPNTKVLIIIDEAHRFRNNESKSYAYLKQICMGHKIMLLTATPINNTSSDIFSLIELFQDLNKATIYNNRSIVHLKETILNKEKELRKSDDPLNKEKLTEISELLIKLIQPVLIRRTRNDLLSNPKYKQDLEKQKTEFNNVEEPQLHDYDLHEFSSLYNDTLNMINPKSKENKTEETKDENESPTPKFLAVRYQSLNYLTDDVTIRNKILTKIYPERSSDTFVRDSSRNLAQFMRHLLVRRFESSIESFRKSIDNMIKKYENILEWIDRDRFPISKRGLMINIDELFRDSELYDTDEEIDELGQVIDYEQVKKFEDKGLHIIENVKESFTNEFFTQMQADLSILQDIQTKWNAVDKDYKLQTLQENLQKWLKENPDRKIVIFSEFSDTVNYLTQKLKDKFRVLEYTSKHTSTRETLIRNFDASAEKQDNNYDILIATDTLSEGVNLHRAGIIINYDIPYNPTRIIQRVGRINRIGQKKFAKLFIHNFIPRLEAQEELNNLQIARFKINLINGLLGNDTKVIDKVEDIKALFQIQDNKWLKNNELSWEIEYQNTYDALKEAHLLDKNGKAFDIEYIRNLPPRLELQRTYQYNGFVEIVRFHDELFTTIYHENKEDIPFYSLKDAFEILKADIDESYQKSSIDFPERKRSYYKKQKESYQRRYTHPAIGELKELLNTSTLSEDRSIYIKDLINIAEDRHIPLSTLKFIQKNKLARIINLDKLEVLIPKTYIERIANRRELINKSLKEAHLLVTEELKQI